MRPNPWIYPSLALLATGGWIVSEKRGAATLEREISVIEQRIVRARAETETDAAASAGKLLKDKNGGIDWKDLAGKIGRAEQGGIPDIQTMIRMQRLLMDLSSGELRAQLDEINVLDIPDDARARLQGMVFGIFAEKDPRLALDWASENPQEEGVLGWLMGAALRNWADKDPAAAIAWLDQQNAAGKLESKSLDGSNSARVRLESMLLPSILKRDPAAATARVAALTEAERAQVFDQGGFLDINPKNQAALAQLIRDTMPADKVGGILAEKTRWLAMREGYEHIDEFIENTRANDSEKEAIVKEVVSHKIPRDEPLDEANIDKARAWAQRQSPAIADKATGEALANAMSNDDDFEKASALVLKYHDAAANDDVLAAFLKSESFSDQNALKAAKLIDKIKDPVLREEIRRLPQYKPEEIIDGR